MKKENVLVILPRLSEGNGSAKREWFIEFYFREKLDQPFIRYRKTEGFYKYKNAEKKRAHGQRLSDKYAGLLRDGWNPAEKKKVLYKQDIHSKGDEAQVKEVRYNIEYFVNLYFTKKKEELRDKTLSTYLTKLKDFTGWIQRKKYSHFVPKQFTRQHAQEYADSVKLKVRHNHTYNSYIESIKAVFNWIENYREDLIDKNPFNKIPKLKYSTTPKRPFNKQQRDLIFKTLEERGDDRLLLACKLIYYTFIRPGRELHGIQIEDIDLITPLLWINSDTSKNKKTFAVPLPEEIVTTLKQWKLDLYPDTHYLFGRGNKISQNNSCRDDMSKRFTRLIRGLRFGPEYTIYSWKHTGNQVAHANGMPLEKQRRLNRHHSLDEMQTYLSGLSPLKSEELSDYFRD